MSPKHTQTFLEQEWNPGLLPDKSVLVGFTHKAIHPSCKITAAAIEVPQAHGARNEILTEFRLPQAGVEPRSSVPQSSA